MQHLLVIDAGLRAIGMEVGEWMVTTNPAPVLAGSAPVDYLARTGTRGCEALARQVDRWRGRYRHVTHHKVVGNTVDYGDYTIFAQAAASPIKSNDDAILVSHAFQTK